MGWGPTRRCGSPVHPGYTICPSCFRPYMTDQIKAAEERDQRNRELAKMGTGQ
jgi:uncharacterized OB-fold protein